MAQLGCRAPALRSCLARPRRNYAVIARAQSGITTTVRFKIHRHVEYGQSLLVVGNVPELGSWDAKQAVELNWGEGDNWSVSLDIPAGSAVEYKYITKRKDTLDWCPGQNKGFSIPAAAVVEVADSWDGQQHDLLITKPLETVAPPAPPAPPAPAPVPVPPAVVAIPTVTEVRTAPTAVEFFTSSPAVTEAMREPDESDLCSAVSTVENIHVAELEGAIAGADRVAAAPQLEPHVMLANNIVQGVPLGAVSVSQDPITQYEEADKYQVVEVGTSETPAATATEPKRAARSVDSMTVAELKTELKRRGMSSLGTRRELINRLQKAGALP